MAIHTDNAIVIDAPLSYVWARTTDLTTWPQVFPDCAGVEILETAGDTTLFRLTLRSAEHGGTRSQVYHRTLDRDTATVLVRQVDDGPFAFWNCFWHYSETESGHTRLRWLQDAQTPVGAADDDDAVRQRLDARAQADLRRVRDHLIAARGRPVGVLDVVRKGAHSADLRILLAPGLVGSTSGFAGIVSLGPGESVIEHYHPYSEEFLIVVSGSVRVDLNGEPRGVSADEGLLVPREVRHRVINIDDTPARVVFFLSPLAPRPDLGHVDTETRQQADEVARAACAAAVAEQGVPERA